MWIMQHGAIFIFLMFLPLAMVFSRRCYECTSEHSFEACTAKQYRVTCKNPQWKCVSASIHTTWGLKYVKGCTSVCSASDIPICNHLPCELTCCSQDYCNKYLPSPAKSEKKDYKATPTLSSISPVRAANSGLLLLAIGVMYMLVL